MNKTLVAVIVGLVALGSAVGVIALSGRDDTGTATNTQQSNTQSSDMADMDASQSPTPQTETDEVLSGTVQADIRNFEFMPKNMKVKKGTTVVWTNQDSARHDVAGMGEGGPSSELLAKGETYSFTFNTVGTFDYICTPHPFMKASVEVVE